MNLGEVKVEIIQKNITEWTRLSRREWQGAIPDFKEITFEQFQELKKKYKYPLRTNIKLGKDWRSYALTLESFDESFVDFALLMQYKSKGWQWLERYKLIRDKSKDEETGVSNVIRRLRKRMGGIEVGMTITEVIQKKGKHFKINYGSAGPCHLVYDDITIHVYGMFVGKNWITNGVVTDIKSTSNRMKERMSRNRYQDDKIKFKIITD